MTDTRTRIHSVTRTSPGKALEEELRCPPRVYPTLRLTGTKCDTSRDHLSRDHVSRDHMSRNHLSRDHMSRDHMSRDHAIVRHVTANKSRLVR